MWRNRAATSKATIEPRNHARHGARARGGRRRHPDTLTLFNHDHVNHVMMIRFANLFWDHEILLMPHGGLSPLCPQPIAKPRSSSSNDDVGPDLPQNDQHFVIKWPSRARRRPHRQETRLGHRRVCNSTHDETVDAAWGREFVAGIP